ncbi:DUF4091 domain-containing protein [bacterium]|nr:DUF4091 domain-containing protein [bacterium]
MLIVLFLLGLIGQTFSQDFLVWTEPATLKVFKDSEPKLGKSRLILQSARNEYESGQIVIRAGANTLKISQVECTPLNGPDKYLIPKENISVRLVAYVLVRHENRFYPDPLPPFRPCEIKAGENQPLFITIYIPKDAKPGRYTGKITVKFENGASVDIPISLEVWDFTLPDKPSCETAFSIWDNSIWKFEEVQAGTPEGKAMFDKYYWCLVEHRISPMQIPVDVLSPEADKYIADERVTSFALNYSDDVEEMRKRVEHLRKKGLLNKAYFYPLDEPVTKEQYEELKRRVEKIKSIDPKLRIVSPFFRGPDFSNETAYEALDGIINIWCAVTSYFDPQKQLEKKLKGEFSWWYVCCGPGSPYANFHITMDAIDHRILMWQQKKYQVDGLLYWGVNYWAGTPDPWEDMATVKDINPNLYGDGSLLYPGKKVGIDGPVSSLRLEMIRDSFEDYEYLTLLEKLAGQEAVERAIKEVVTDMTNFTKDPATLQKARAMIAKEIQTRMHSNFIGR